MSKKTAKKKLNAKVINHPKAGIHLQDIKPITESQQKIFNSFDNKHLLLHGIAGTGKTFISLYLSLREVLVHRGYRKIVIVRSCVPTREIGFMPGSLEEKLKVYEQPYEEIVNHIANRSDAYQLLKDMGIIEFISTSYIRGLTIDDSIIIVDEIQNMAFGELDSVITRVGNFSKIIFCGDFRQTDLQSQREKTGIHDFIKVLSKLQNIEHVEFTCEDIVRSGFVKNYIMAKMELGFA